MRSLVPRVRSFRFMVVDAFTDRPFTGNPAAVVLPDPERPPHRLPDELLQAIAAEMNLSETAFPGPPDRDGSRPLRWFTPTTEVPLCGHATLATAHALIEEGERPPFRFLSHSGPLGVTGNPDGSLEMDFPADPPTRVPAPPRLLEALGVPLDSPVLSGRNAALVRVEDERRLRELSPDYAGLARVHLPDGALGVTVTAPSREPGVDFASRFFAPWVGVDEDPVTGVAHTVLTPYWATELGKSEMEARQRSSRGGALGVRMEGSRVVLVGHAVTVIRGILDVPV